MHEVPAPQLARARIQHCQQQPQQMGPGVQDGNLPWGKKIPILTSVPSPKQNTLTRSIKMHSLRRVFRLRYFHLLFTLSMPKGTAPCHYIYTPPLLVGAEKGLHETQTISKNYSEGQLVVQPATEHWIDWPWSAAALEVSPQRPLG